jgi:hypothetical protein
MLSNSAGLQSPEDYTKFMASQTGKKKTAQPPGPGESAGKDTIPPKYASIASSGLSRTVVKGEPNDFTFELTD